MLQEERLRALTPVENVLPCARADVGRGRSLFPADPARGLADRPVSQPRAGMRRRVSLPARWRIPRGCCCRRALSPASTP
ncbi:MAG: hypothetical protein ACLU0O_09470 [Collinsella sp.]